MIWEGEGTTRNREEEEEEERRGGGEEKRRESEGALVDRARPGTELFFFFILTHFFSCTISFIKHQ